MTLLISLLIFRGILLPSVIDIVKDLFPFCSFCLCEPELYSLHQGLTILVCKGPAKPHSLGVRDVFTLILKLPYKLNGSTFEAEYCAVCFSKICRIVFHIF